MKILKYLPAAAAAISLNAALCAAETARLRAYPVSFPSADSAPIESKAAVVAEIPEDERGLFEAAKSALASDPKALGLSASEARRAAAYKKIARPDPSKFLASAKIGEYFAVFPAASAPMPKGRPNINFMVFKRDSEKYAWLPSFNDPILQVMADGAAKSRETNRGAVKPLTESDAKILAELEKKSLPFLNFANGPLVSLEELPDADSHEASKFYRAAQNVFYSWKIDEYGKFLTPRTKAAFDAQFGSMTEEQRRRALGDYFSWGKKYLKAMDASPVYAMIFLRTKDGETPRPDFAYLLKDGGKFKIAVFTDSKTPLEAFLGKYLLTDSPYAENMAKKFAPNGK